jgi:hypothetical protein
MVCDNAGIIQLCTFRQIISHICRPSLFFNYSEMLIARVNLLALLLQ